jgi:hypothetical protein
MSRDLSIAAIAGTAVAAAAGVMWTLSPLALVVAGALAALCVGTTRDLDAPERRRVRQLLAVAIGVRMLLLAGIFAATPAAQQVSALFPDAHYLIDRSIWLRNLWLNVPIGPHQYVQIFRAYGASSFATFLAVLQVPVGPAPFGLSLLSVTIFMAGVLIMFRVARHEFGPTAALAGLAAVLFWPSLAAWSISVLKEPVQFCLASIVCAGAVSFVRADARIRSLAAAALVGAVALLTTLRAGGMEIAVTGLVVAAAIRVMAWRRWVIVALVVLGAVAGWAVRGRVAAPVKLAASRHIGHVKSAGVSYRLLDARYYSDSGETAATMPFTDGVRFLAASAIAFVAVPLPWQTGSRGTLALLPQQLAWYVMCAAALVGFVVGMRRAPWLACVLGGAAIAGLLIIAPNSGNVGTLVRHRDLIVPFVLWLGGMGLVGIAEAAREWDRAPDRELTPQQAR